MDGGGPVGRSRHDCLRQPIQQRRRRRQRGAGSGGRRGKGHWRHAQRLDPPALPGLCEQRPHPVFNLPPAHLPCVKAQSGVLLSAFHLSGPHCDVLTATYRAPPPTSSPPMAVDAQFALRLSSTIAMDKLGQLQPECLEYGKVSSAADLHCCILLRVAAQCRPCASLQKCCCRRQLHLLQHPAVAHTAPGRRL